MTSTDHGAAGVTLVEYDEIDSTNSEAMRRVSAGELGPLWVLAHRQTAGRGRSGRSWQSARGNLAASLIFEPKCQLTNVPQLSLLAGVAVHEALETVWPRGAVAGRLRLKWPNDLLIDAAKTGGILVESTTSGGSIVAVIGIGLNVASGPVVSERTITCLANHVPDLPDVGTLVRLIAARVDRWLEVWQGGAGFSSVRAEWLTRAGSIGEPMTVNAGDGPVEGTFAGLDTEGALLLCGANGRQRRFTFGDVTLGTVSKA